MEVGGRTCFVLRLGSKTANKFVKRRHLRKHYQNQMLFQHGTRGELENILPASTRGRCDGIRRSVDALSHCWTVRQGGQGQRSYQFEHDQESKGSRSKASHESKGSKARRQSKGSKGSRHFSSFFQPIWASSEPISTPRGGAI